MLKKLLLPTALFAATATATAYAQQPAKPAEPTIQVISSLSPEQQAQLIKQNQQIAAAASEVAQLVDQAKIGDIWDGASEIAKKAVSRGDFVKMIASDRKTVGAVKLRVLAGVSRAQSNGSGTPVGSYLSVAFNTQFAKSQQPVRELVSFHLDTDRKWRVAGYTMR